MKSTRQYVMRARAESAGQTRTRIIRAAIDLCMETMSLDFGLSEVAARAGVSVQTLLRHFGSREGVLDAARRTAEAEIIEERRAVPGDAAAAVRAIAGHYERSGDWSLAMLAREGRDERARQVTDRGRRVHRDWVETVFGPQLAAARDDRAETVDMLVVATDVYAWKLLRRDRRLSRVQVERRMLSLVTAIVSAREA